MIMPVGPFENFDACVIGMMQKEGYDEETAKKVCGKMQAEHEGMMSLSLRSTLEEKPVREGRELVVPFVKDGTVAFNAQGKKYILTAEALQKDFMTWKGGNISVNHKVMSEGRISDVWYKAPFVYGRITGLTDEVLSVIDSAAYRGVSQESNAVNVDKDGNVTSLKGTGTTIVVFPENPACPLNQGCGTIESDFSLNNQNLNQSIKSTGGTNNNMANETDGADALKSITAERDALKLKVDALTAEISGLKSTTSDPSKRIAELEKDIKQMKEQNALTIKSAIESREAAFEQKVALKQETDNVISELRSIMRKDVLDKMLFTKPSLEVLRSNLEVLKMSGLATHVGAGYGEMDLQSTQKIKTELQKMNIPMIEFSEGAR